MRGEVALLVWVDEENIDCGGGGDGGVLVAGYFGGGEDGAGERVLEPVHYLHFD